MNWEPIADFVRTEDPAFAASLRGVPKEDVERLEHERAIQLPRAYRGFLFTMGEDSDGFYLFGPHRKQRLADLVASGPPRSYPGKRYFKIGAAADPFEISPPDYFLDLSGSDGVDAPIVTFQTDEEMAIEDFRTEYVLDTSFTFGEQAASRIFTFLVLDRAAEHSRVLIGGMEAREREQQYQDVIAVFKTMNFRPVLASNERVSCFRRDSMAALVNVRDDLRCVTITLGGDDSQRMKVLVDQLALRFPDAAVRGTGGARGR